jgi:hypothetical protein
LKLTNPQAGLAFDLEGPDAQAVTQPPAPRFDSKQAAAEMRELYWMALARDVPFINPYLSHTALPDPAVGGGAVQVPRGHQTQLRARSHRNLEARVEPVVEDAVPVLPRRPVALAERPRELTALAVVRRLVAQQPAQRGVLSPLEPGRLHPEAARCTRVARR